MKHKEPPDTKALIDQAKEYADQLQPVRHLLTDNERDLLDKVRERIGTYGYSAFISEKQVLYLGQIVKRCPYDPNQLNLF